MQQFLGLALVVLGLLWPQIQNLDINLPIISTEPSVRQSLLIETPETEYLTRSRPLSELYANAGEDREKFAVFNYEFAQRVPTYQGTLDEIGKVYKGAALQLFGTDFQKYKAGATLENANKAVVGDRDGYSTPEDGQQLHKQYESHAYALGDKHE